MRIPDPLQFPVQPQASSAAAFMGTGESIPVLIINTDINNTIYAGYRNQSKVGDPNTVPIGPQQSVIMDGARTIYVIGPTGTANATIIPGGTAFFQPATRISAIGPGAGFFVYDPAKVLGDLLASITASTTGPLGETTQKGITVYAGTGFIQLSESGAQCFLVMRPNGTTHLAVPAQLFASVQNAGLVNESLEVQLFTGQETGQPQSAIVLDSAAADGSFLPFQRFFIGNTVELQISSTVIDAFEALTAHAGLTVLGETTMTPTQLSGAPVIATTDASTVTVTQAVNTALTALWSILANDAKVNTQYRFKCGGFGTQGSTAQTLRIQFTFMGANIGSDTIPTAQLPLASTVFEWEFEGTATVTSLGVAGTARAHGTFTLWDVGGPLSTSVVIGDHTGVDVTVDTTTTHTTSLGAQWGSTTGAPTITSRWSTRERIGA